MAAFLRCLFTTNQNPFKGLVADGDLWSFIHSGAFVVQHMLVELLGSYSAIYHENLSRWVVMREAIV